MMNICFSNKYGGVVFHGGNNGDGFKITEIVGLGLPGVTLNTINYAGQEGRETLSSMRTYRTITMKGDIEGANKDYEIRRAIKIFSEPVEMEISVNGRRRKCMCRCTTFDPPFGKKHFKEFVMQLECDSPYFMDVLETKERIYGIDKHLTLKYVNYFKDENGQPTYKVISEIVHKVAVYNSGDVKAEPIITIINTGVTTEKTDGIKIFNETTNQKICLDYVTHEGETIVVNIPERKIYSNIEKNLINLLTDDSFLSDFYLDEGTNIISVEVNFNEKIVSYCSFNNQYLEAMN